MTDYNPLMKDFPINDLLAATELERIRTSVQTIFTHLRKIRNTKYPIQRALRLVEAISRDLVNQMLKVLNTRRLMFISFEEFEKVMLLCVDVFATWDDEYDRLQVVRRVDCSIAYPLSVLLIVQKALFKMILFAKSKQAYIPVLPSYTLCRAS